MSSRGESVELTDFTGGLNTFDPEYLVPLNQAADLQNIVLLSKGFRKRNGDTAFNSAAMVSGSTAVVGGGWVRFDSGTEFLNVIAGTKFFTSSALSGTMADATGAVSITSGQNNLWTPSILWNLQVWFGGAPDAPFKYSGTGNATALGGSPPSAATAFAANNRVFAISTAANPSRIFWPVVTSVEDWTGTGSGNADVAASDGEALQCGIPLGHNRAILFKNSSTHFMDTTRAPFPIYQLQKGAGIAGRRAGVNVNGVIYFITPARRMKSTTDGVNFQDYPKSIDNIWDSINTERIAYIVGEHDKLNERITWCVSIGSSTTNNYSIVWDLKNECWLQDPTGFKCNVLFTVQNRRLFGGHYNGKIFEKHKATVFTDASEASPGAIDAFWRTPFKGLGPLDTVIHPHYVTVSALSESSSTLTISYGFDFTSNEKSQDFSLLSPGGQWDVAQWDVDVWGGQTAVGPRMFIKGRGNIFSLRFRNATASHGYTIQGASVRLRSDRARKRLTTV